MAGTALAAGTILAAAAVAAGLASAGAAAVSSQRAAGAADNAAVAAADTAAGAVPGVPCERAAEVAASFGVVVTRCEVEDLHATVTVTGRFLGMPVAARARAGPAVVAGGPVTARAADTQ